MTVRSRRRGRSPKCCCGFDPPTGCSCDEVYCEDDDGAWCLYGPSGINYSVAGELVGVTSNYDAYVPCYTLDRHPLEPDHYSGCGATPTFPNWPPPSSFDCGWASQSFAMSGVDISSQSCTFQAILTRATTYCPYNVAVFATISQANSGPRTKLKIISNVRDTLYGIGDGGDIGLQIEFDWTNCTSQTFTIPLQSLTTCTWIQMCKYNELKITLTRIV